MVKDKNVTVVLGMGPTGLGVVRSLGHNGVSVLGLDFDTGLSGLKSKYCKAMLCPHPINEQAKLFKLMVKVGSTLNKKGVLYPTSDEFVKFVSVYREGLEKLFLVAIPDRDLVETFLNKNDTYIIANNNGIPLPQTLMPQSTVEIANIANKIDYPVFIKPCLTYEWKIAKFDTKGFIANNPQQLIKLMREIFKKKVKVIIQSIIQGPVEDLYEVCCYCGINETSSIGFVKRKLRQFPNDFGLGSYMESVRHDDLLRKSLNFLNEIGFKGPAEIEFKKDERDGQFKLIEVNVRLTLQNSLAEACGINFPLIQYCDLIGEETDFFNGYKEGIKWVWGEIDFQAFLELKKKKQLGFLEWIQSIYYADEYAIFSWNDLGPFFKSINYGLDILKIPFSMLRKLLA